MDEIFVRNLNALKGRESANSFASKCDIKPQTMRNYLNGDTDPNLPALRKISAAMGISIGEMVGDAAPATGHNATNATGVVQAGGTVSISGMHIGDMATTRVQLNDIEIGLIERLRLVGSPIVIKKIMDQLQQLEDFVRGK